MTWMLIVCLLPGADAAAKQQRLQEFRAEFIKITPGQGRFPRSFQMGATDNNPQAQPLHEVTMDHDYEIGKYEITQDLWEQVMGTNPSRWKGPRNSVEELSYDDAVEFCRRVTQALREAQLINRTQQVRLPSEAEWEYATRAGSQGQYCFGDAVEQLGQFAWYTANAAGNDPPVGVKAPNAWGLYDVHGYLWEWCRDEWHENYDGAPHNSRAWIDAETPTHRVLRGGSWKDGAEQLTSFVRRKAAVNFQDDAVGLRCVLAEMP